MTIGSKRYFTSGRVLPVTWGNPRCAAGTENAGADPSTRWRTGRSSRAFLTDKFFLGRWKCASAEEFPDACWSIGSGRFESGLFPRSSRVFLYVARSRRLANCSRGQTLRPSKGAT